MAQEKKHISISEVNSLSYEDFISTFGNVVEHSALCAAAIWTYRPFKDVTEIQSRISEFLDQLPLSGKEGTLRLYPDLAGRLARHGGLTQESVKEHACAGLDTLTEMERAKMNELNSKYKDNFGFPFVICARENKKDAILNGLEQRLKNSREIEANTGLNEVKKICNLRLKDIVDETL